MKWILLVFFCVTSSFATQVADNALTVLKLKPGFSISIYASPVIGARSMCLGDNGTVFVGSGFKGRVYAIVPDATQPFGTKVYQITQGLRLPNGVAFKDGSLYVAAIDRIYRFDNIESRLENPPQPVTLTDHLPDPGQTNGLNPSWRYIRISPENKLYIGVGAPCDSCIPEDPRFGTIMRMNLDGTGLEIYAKGIENSQGFAWDPLNGKMWFTENVSYWINDNAPPDNLHFAPKKDMNFGFPYYHGNFPDPTYGTLFPASAFTHPVFEFPAHTEVLGMVFYTGTMFPLEYRNQIFVAAHGSFDRNTTSGYQVSMLRMNKARDGIESIIPFITGWNEGGQIFGRPVDLLVMKDGSMLISDDYANVIYRVTYQSRHLRSLNE